VYVVRLPAARGARRRAISRKKYGLVRTSCVKAYFGRGRSGPRRRVDERRPGRATPRRACHLRNAFARRHRTDHQARRAARRRNPDGRRVFREESQPARGAPGAVRLAPLITGIATGSTSCPRFAHNWTLPRHDRQHRAGPESPETRGIERLAGARSGCGSGCESLRGHGAAAEHSAAAGHCAAAEHCAAAGHRAAAGQASACGPT